MKKKTAHKSHAPARRVHSPSYSHHTEETKSFLVHAIIYTLVNVGLFVYFFSNSQDLTLFNWVVVGWGIGLLAHAFAAFGWLKILSKEW